MVLLTKCLATSDLSNSCLGFGKHVYKENYWTSLTTELREVIIKEIDAETMIQSVVLKKKKSVSFMIVILNYLLISSHRYHGKGVLNCVKSWDECSVHVIVFDPDTVCVLWLDSCPSLYKRVLQGPRLSKC